MQHNEFKYVIETYQSLWPIANLTDEIRGSLDHACQRYDLEKVKNVMRAHHRNKEWPMKPHELGLTLKGGQAASQDWRLNVDTQSIQRDKASQDARLSHWSDDELVAARDRVCDNNPGLKPLFGHKTPSEIRCSPGLKQHIEKL